MRSNGRAQTASWLAIDGIEPGRVVAPASPEAVAEVLGDAAASGLAVAPIGGGTALSLGNPIERYDIALSTEELRDVLDYEPMDLVLSVEAGARFADVQSALAEHGQHLPVETPFPERSTIGGMIATARSGPRRLSSGSLRDLLIGMSVAHASGTVTKCGGMVVKNVSGYDMPRIYHGSLGTLGVVISANFKVVPLPRAERTLLGQPQALAAALATIAGLQATGLPFVALELMGEVDGWCVAVRFEGRERSVESLSASSRGMLGADVEELRDDASRRWWQGYIDGQAADGESMIVRSSVRPRQSMDLVRATERTLSELDVWGHRVWASPGLGIVHTMWTCRGDDPESVARSHALCATLGTLCNHSIVTAAPPEVKREIDVWGGEPETLDVMRQLKHEFDPSRVLNPGRFVGRM